jgi:hypothetical protein
MRNPLRAVLAVVLLGIATPTMLLAQALASRADRAGDTGVSAIWMLANFSYAGMRAQNHPSAGWRIVAFIFGFPGTLLSLLVIPEGGERAYGVDVPRKERPVQEDARPDVAPNGPGAETPRPS